MDRTDGKETATNEDSWKLSLKSSELKQGAKEYICVHISIITQQYSQKHPISKCIPVLTIWMDKQNVVYAYNEVMSSLEKEEKS